MSSLSASHAASCFFQHSHFDDARPPRAGAWSSPSGYNIEGTEKQVPDREIEVTFDGQVLRPDAPLDLEPNRKYRVRIQPADSKLEPQNSLLRIRDLARDLGVSDLAEQHDHYLYATPKK